jgi:transglutaminase-like putative cysteine protease
MVKRGNYEVKPTMKKPTTDMGRYLKPTPNIDSDNEAIINKALSLTEGKLEATERARSLFYFVRDQIKYNPYRYTLAPEHFRASRTLHRGDGYCVQKAVLLAALARAVVIPARLLFADIRNHLISQKQIDSIQGGINVFTHHGYCELHIEGKWVKATPAFDLKTCIKHRLVPAEFDGRRDAILHSHDQEGELHIEYVRIHGNYDDVPLEEIVYTSIQVYGFERTKVWQTGFWADAAR